MNRTSAAVIVFWCILTGYMAVIPGNAAGPNQQTSTCSAWQDNFNTGQLDTTRWTVASGQAPGYIANQHIGYFLPGNVSLANGLLTLTLNQQSGTVGSNASGVISNGAMIQTKVVCGYGTYQWRMRMSSATNCFACSGVPISGSVSAGFIYVNNSQTEIDVEFAANYSPAVWFVNWLNKNSHKNPTSSDETPTAVYPSSPFDTFHDYKFVWSAGKTDFFIDGVLAVTHTTDVGTAPAYFMITHWGSDSTGWGGLATLNTPRYFYVTHASYTPQ